MSLPTDVLNHSIPETVSTISNNLHHATGMGVYVLYKKGMIQLLGDQNTQRFSEFLFKTSLIEDAEDALYPKPIYALFLGNMAAILHLKLEDDYSLLIGPYRTETTKCPMSDAFFQKLSENDRQDFMNLCSRFPLKSELAVQAIAQTAFALKGDSGSHHSEINPVMIKSRTPESLMADSRFKPSEANHNRMVKQIFSYVQAEENPNVSLMIRDLVCSGNSERAIEIYQKSMDHIAKPLPNTQCPRKQEVYHRIGLLFSIFYKMVESSVDHQSLVALKNKYLEQFHRTKCTHEMDLIAMDMFSGFALHAKLSMQIESYTELIQKAIVFIYEHSKAKISLKDVAAALHVNACYLSSIFKKETGKSLTVFITELKVEEAKRLLESTAFPITTICYEIGFDNPSYFTEVFKKVTGMTPKDYKAQLKTV